MFFMTINGVWISQKKEQISDIQMGVDEDKKVPIPDKEDTEPKVSVALSLSLSLFFFWNGQFFSSSWLL